MRRKKTMAVAGLLIVMLGALAMSTVCSGEMERQVEMVKREENNLKNPGGGVGDHGELSVVDGNLVDQHGEVVQLRGISSHGILWYPQYGNYRSIRTLREALANVFRIAMYTTEGRGYDLYPNEAKLAMRCTLENALGADMYAIVDWHVLKEENPNVYLHEAMAFFDEISSLYADEPGVIYEICNEPNGDTSWEDIKNYANQVIPVIRKNAPRAVILVGTPSYSTRIKDAADDPLAFDNILYTFHYYADLSGDEYEASIDYARERNVGIFVSEWGIGSDYDDQGYHALRTKASGFLDYLDQEGISWVSWALSNKDEGHSILKPDTQALSGWSQDELTNYGRFVFDRLRLEGGE